MRISLFTLFLLLTYKLYAGEADVIAAEVKHTGGDFYQFTVTIEHNDESWEHLAKAWEVLDSEGNVLGVRILRHPHINEQPFTRSQTIALPENINQVTIRAYDLTHKFGGKEFTLNINKESKNEKN
jgi:hypothetical protein